MLYQTLDVLMYIILAIVIPMSINSAKISLQIAREYSEAGKNTDARFNYSVAVMMIAIAITTSVLAIYKFGNFALIILSSIS